MDSVINAPDQRDGLVYDLTEELRLAVDVALATGRPLLLRGDPGSGKSSLAPFVARQRDWRYYEHVITSRTQGRDMLWTFDSVRRLADAQLPGSQNLVDFRYVEPGVLWWALAPESARLRGNSVANVPWSAEDPLSTINSSRSPEHAVVLIDEIDKADPDVPNSLLVPLGSHEFTVAETGVRVRREHSAAKHLVIVTTNEERELPEAFLRRCVVIWLPAPDPGRLVAIAKLHMERYYGSFGGADRRLAHEVAEQLAKAREEAHRLAIRPPSTAEYLDALHACRALGITVESPQWDQLRRLTMIKPRRPER